MDENGYPHEQHHEDEADFERRRLARGVMFDAIERHVHKQGITDEDLVEGIMGRVVGLLDKLTERKGPKPDVVRTLVIEVDVLNPPMRDLLTPYITATTMLDEGVNMDTRLIAHWKDPA